jgi:hypothetical protein
MSGILIANKNEKINISAPDVYGAVFKISVFSQDTNQWIITNAEMDEYVDATDDISVISNIEGLKGDNAIEVDHPELIEIGYIIKINNFYYRVKAKNNNKLFLHMKLKNIVSVDSQITVEGNMALYYLDVNISVPGDYLIRAKDTVFGLEITDSIKVVPKSIETMVKDIKNLEYAILGQ